MSNEHVHPIFRDILNSFARVNNHRDPPLLAYCDRLGRPCPTSGPCICAVDPDEDPTSWCEHCGAMQKRQCSCGPIADND